MRRGKEFVEVKPKNCLHVNDFLFVKQLLLNHCGIAYVPSVTIANELERRELARVLSDWRLMEQEIYVVYPSERHLSPKMRAFIEFVDRKAIGERWHS